MLKTCLNGFQIALKLRWNSVEFLKYKADKRSRLLLTSGGDQPVLDGVGEQHSIFAQAFLDSLRTNKGIMTGPELFKAVKSQVVDNSQQDANFDQQPEYKAIKGAGHEVGEFFFVRQANNS